MLFLYSDPSPRGGGTQGAAASGPAAATAAAGWASGVGLILFFGGFQFIVLGVLGEYLARIYDEVKMRPLYVVASTLGSFARRERKEPS